jgi:hypothetical protein
MPRYISPVNDTSRYNGINLGSGDGVRSNPSLGPTNSGGSKGSSK